MPTSWTAGERGLARVIAIGGETIACCDTDGKVTVDGTAIDEPYVQYNSPLDLPAGTPGCRPRRFNSVAVPDNEIFVMGDRRDIAADSRCRGPIPASNVIAVITAPPE